MVCQRGLDATFTALADGTRRAILAHLMAGDMAMGDLAAHFPMTLPAVRKHVRMLERAGLVRVRKEGRTRRARLNAEPMRHAVSWIERYRVFWEYQFDQLEAFFAETDGGSRELPSRRKKTPARKAGGRRGRA
jgi:DNA-binding transcriptional ArsR family regulator